MPKREIHKIHRSWLTGIRLRNSVSGPILARIGRPEISGIFRKNVFLALWGDYIARNLLKTDVSVKPRKYAFWRNFFAKIPDPKLTIFGSSFGA